LEHGSILNGNIRPRRVSSQWQSTTMASRSASSPADLAASMRHRLLALSAAHELTMPILEEQEQGNSTVTLLQLIGKVVAPYQDPDGQRISLTGTDVPLGPNHATKFALLFHELATNAAKYGALSAPEGKVTVRLQCEGGVVCLEWLEEGGPTVPEERALMSFGTRLIDSTAASFPAIVKRDWRPEGLAVVLEVGADVIHPASS